MTLQDLQSDVDHWIRNHGVRYFDPLTNLALLMEEVGEFARLVARVHGEQSFKEGSVPDNTTESMADEMADILFVLTCLANQLQIDLVKSMQLNLVKKTTRDSERHKANPKLENPPESNL